MKRILFLLLFFVFSCSTTSRTVSNNKNLGANNLESPFSGKNVDKVAESKQYNTIFIPIVVDKNINNFPLAIESLVKERFINKISDISLIFYANKVMLPWNFVKPETDSIISWSTNKLFIEGLNEKQIGESVILSRAIRKSNAQYILIPQFKDILINDNVDKVPYTKLTSVIINVNTRIKFYLITIPDGILVKRFIASGHSGVSNLSTNVYDIKHYNINSLLDDSTRNLTTSIITNMVGESYDVTIENEELN